MLVNSPDLLFRQTLQLLNITVFAVLYVSYCTRPEIAYTRNKLTKFLNNPGVVHYRAILHLIGYIKNILNKQLKFYSDYKKSPVYKILVENHIDIEEDTIVTFTDSHHGMIVQIQV